MNQPLDKDPRPPMNTGEYKAAEGQSCSLASWCTGMGIALRGVEENAESKGLSVARGTLSDTDPAPRILWITYHPRARDQGLILNFCPWCGAGIRFDEMMATP